MVIKKLQFLLLFLPIFGCAQHKAVETGLVEDKEFDKKVNSYLKGSVPFIGVKELREIQKEVTIFDTRKLKEYKVSHIENAIHLGYRNFDKQQLKDVQKDQKIILYCSIGYRSEKIGEKLQKLGYKHVYNLYGSIFEWVNQGYTIVDDNGQPTEKIHTYNSNWSKWVKNDTLKKVW